MLLQMALFHSLYGWVIFHRIHVPPLPYPFTSWWTLGCFHVLGIVNSAARNTGVHVFFWVMAFSGYVSRSRITGSYKWLSEEALQIPEKRRKAKGKGEKERYTHLNAEFQRTARRDKKAFLSDQCKEIEENNRMGKITISSRKWEIPRDHFMQRWAR